MGSDHRPDQPLLSSAFRRRGGDHSTKWLTFAGHKLIIEPGAALHVELALGRAS